MADDISRAFCGAYKDILKSGIAEAKTGSELRKAKTEEFRRDPLLIDNSKRKQDIEAQKAYLETVMGKDYEELVSESKKEKEKMESPEFDTEIAEDIMDIYMRELK